MSARTLVSAVLVAGLAVPYAAAAQTVSHVEAVAEAQPVITPACGGGVVYDDGGFESAYSIGDGDPGDSTMVMKFNLPFGTTALDQACICFTRLSGGPASMTFDIVVYNDNGPGGQPGTLVGTQAATASSIPVFGAAAFYGVNLTGSGIALPDTSVYVGARWPGGSILMCGDRSAGTTQRTNYGSGNLGATWTNLNTLFSTTPPRAMGIRVDPAGGGGPSVCIPNATTLCLNSDRFKVQATFLTGAGASGNAQVVELTEDTGYLWFFSASNVEVVVKVLNACAFNSRYWVFAGGLTDVRVVMTVTDTNNGTVRTYINPQGTPFQPIQDTSAFATCP
jgi:hypothetical protein